MSLWSLGSNGHSQLSLNSLEDVSVPALCTIPDSLARSNSSGWLVTCGGNHTLLLTETGDLYGCGSNEYHQLGLDDTKDVMTFLQLHGHKKWKFIACGFSFSVLVSFEDEVFTTGNCTKGSLGLGSKLLQTQALQKVSVPLNGQSITGLTAGIAHVVVQTSSGRLYGWGAGRKGALGRLVAGNLYEPQVIKHDLPNVNQITAGKDWTAAKNDSNILLLGALGRTQATISIDSQSLANAKISGNWSTLNLLMTGHGKIQSFGRADRGQHPPVDLPSIKQLASGSEHSVAIGQNGQIYVWGWNEHGNCGPGLEDVTEVRQLIVPGLGKARGVAAGCGTTFIYCDAQR